MVEMLAIIRSPEEAALVIDLGVDRIGLRVGAGQAIEAGRCRALVEQVGGRRPISLIMEDTGTLATLGENRFLADGRVDEIRLPLPAEAAIPGIPRGKARLIAIVPGGTAATLPEGGGPIAGVMVSRHPGRLLTDSSLADLAVAAETCRARGLTLSLHGGLEAPDISRLLPLQPDDLCFGLGLRRGGDAKAPLDPDAVALCRDLVRHGRDGPAAGWPARIPDRIFLRDWVLPVHIGAYAHEHAAPQRVRFGVEATVARQGGKATDLRDVVSYDLITDSIWRLTRDHVDLVETLAERIAEAVLAHPRVLQVTVTVEKLDLGPGSLGCRIVRDKAG